MKKIRERMLLGLQARRILEATSAPSELIRINSEFQSPMSRSSRIDSVRRDQDGKLNPQIRGRAEVLPVSQAFHYRFKGM